VKEYTTYISTALVKDLGLQVGDVVTLYSRNTIWYPVIGFSALRVGAVACGVSPDYTVDELAYSLRVSKTKFLFTSTSGLEKAHEAAEKAGLPRERVMLIDDSATDNKLSTRQLIQMGQRYAKADQVKAFEIPPGKTNRDICGWLCFSSGTTGLPKAVMISHANVMAQCLQARQITPSDHTRVLAALPFYHITGIVHQLQFPVVLNANVYLLPTFTLDKMLQAVVDYKILELLLVPPILIRLVREPQIVSKYDLSHVKRFASGAAPLSKEILTLLEKKFPGTGFKQGYGMTESCSCVTAHPPSMYAYKYAHKVGTVVASTVIKIVDPETRKTCGVGETGEVWARGPQITMGYLDNPKATTETYDEEGFLHTGDIGSIDEEGMLSITDRLKEMIKVNGIGVAPAELENFFQGHSLVRDVAICGIQDERAGERPKAFIVLQDLEQGGQRSEAQLEDAGRQIFDFARSKMTRHKRPVEVEFVSEIPKSAAGKILRRKFKQVGAVKSGFRVRDDTLKAKI
jgi:acyl-CoA synthetase (AMP-forming)/AMP-acid ligase II